MTPKKRRTPRLLRNRRTFEFVTRYPHGTAAINGYRRAARHFKFHTLEDPSTAGSDTCGLLIHKNAQKLCEAAKILKEAYASDDDGLIEKAELWLACDSGVHWFDHDWKYWDQQQDEGALECLGWERLIVESGARYRVRLRVARKA